MNRFFSLAGEEMVFRLKYDGRLLSSGGQSRVENKHRIRKEIHKQLSVLWKEATPLKVLGGSKNPDGQTESDWLANNFSRGGFHFVPLVNDHWKLVCDLDILFLRREAPGELVKSGGDVDNRIKTLFDALRVPSQLSEIGDGVSVEADEDPFYCLLQDDSLIISFRVTTDRLLIPATSDKDKDERVSDFPLEVSGGRTHSTPPASEPRAGFHRGRLSASRGRGNPGGGENSSR